MFSAASPGLFHLVGYITGATLYAMLLAMVVRPGHRADRLMLGTAVLGLAWNLGEMSVHGTEALGLPEFSHWLAAASYSALGLLAAVVVHSVATGVRGADRTAARVSATRTIAFLAYTCAGVAALLHLVVAATGAVPPSPAGLVIVAGGIAALAVPLSLLTHGQPQAGRGLWMTALAVFAVSAFHLGRFHGANESWATELLGHHASIPLAFAILYQQYRFALADLFLKQALTLIALVGLVLGAYAGIEPSLREGDPSSTALLLSVWAGTAMLFPWLRRGVTAFVDRVVLDRADDGEVLERLGAAVQGAHSIDSVMSAACACLAPALNALSVQWESRRLQSPVSVEPGEVPVWTTDPPHYVLVVGRLAGGRRLLSGDLSMLDRAATIIARRLDALRLIEERVERELIEREIRALASEAELRALRAQVNPHFLFNALTTIGYLIESAPGRALDTLLRLTTLLRGVLRSDGDFTSLRRERELIECYLQIEQERFEERLRVRIDIPRDLDEVMIPALIVQPLVENAIKHGIAPARAGGSVSLEASVDANAVLRIVVRNTGSPLLHRSPGDSEGVGLNNVERRLRCYYGEAAHLTLRTVGNATVAELRLPLTGSFAAAAAMPGMLHR